MLAIGLARTLSPMRCPGCGSPFGDRSELHLCARCLQDLLVETAMEYCRGCGQTAGPFELAEGRCLSCRTKPWPIERVVRVGPHVGVLRRLIVQMKYGKQAWLADGLGRLLAAAGQGEKGLDELDAIIPVPCHWTRPWLGGMDQARLLAEAVERWGGPPIAPALRRTRWCRPQVGLSQAARETNIRGSMGVRGGARLAGKHIGLLDDVATTGETLRECTRVLRSAGVKRVTALIVARAAYASSPPGGQTIGS
jgi:ComF family protein